MYTVGVKCRNRESRKVRPRMMATCWRASLISMNIPVSLLPLSAPNHFLPLKGFHRLTPWMCLVKCAYILGWLSRSTVWYWMNKNRFAGLDDKDKPLSYYRLGFISSDQILIKNCLYIDQKSHPETKITCLNRNIQSGFKKKMKQTACTSECLLHPCVYFLPFRVTPGWWVRHTARRPVQHLPQARWRCRRRQEQQKSARAICCEQVLANCLWELRQWQARASVTWVETNIFIYPRFVEGARFQALKHNRPSPEQEEGGGLEQAAEQVHLCQTERQPQCLS